MKRISLRRTGSFKQIQTSVEYAYHFWLTNGCHNITITWFRRAIWIFDGPRKNPRSWLSAPHANRQKSISPDLNHVITIITTPLPTNRKKGVNKQKKTLDTFFLYHFHKVKARNNKFQQEPKTRGKWFKKFF